MKIGVCISDRYEDAVKAAEFGYDYVESNCQAIAKMDKETLDKFKNLKIPVLASCVFIGMRIVGKDRNEEEIDEYLERMFHKVNYIGVKYLVFGSGGARKMIPEDGLSADETREQVIEFLSEKVVPYLEKYDMTLVIEPLRREECNIINTVSQAIDIADRIGNDHIKVLGDLKHMVCVNDPLDALAEYGKYLVHGHTSNPYPDPSLGKKRVYPKVGDAFDQDSFFIPMMKAGVEHISIEADLIDFDIDAPEALEALKKYR